MTARGPAHRRRPTHSGLRCLTLCGLLFGLFSNQAFAQLAPAIGLNLDVNEQSLVNFGDLMTIPDAKGQDSNGWPTSDFTLQFDNRYTFAWSPEISNIDPLKYSNSLAGRYKLTYRGQAEVSNAVHSLYDSVTNTTTAEYEIVEPPGSPGSLLRIAFTRTQRTPESPLGSGVTNIRLARLEYNDRPNQIFTDLWLDSIKQYAWAALRCMEMVRTNEYGAPGSREAYPYRLAWDSDRRLPDTGPLIGKSQAGLHGIVAWEHIVTLAQLTHKDLWINIPVNASDEYVDHLASLLKNGNAATGNAGIPPDINLYVEYSNELWHTLFPQGSWNQDAARDEVKAGGTNLNYDGSTSTPQQWRFRRIAKRTVEIGRQFRKAFGDQPERIRPVINNHATAADYDMLQYVAANYGQPSGVLYGISQQGYYTSADSSSVIAILEGEKAASDRNRTGYIASRTLATYFGLHSLAYEGGQQEKGGNTPAIPEETLSNKFAAARAPGMKDVVLHDLLANWFPSGGELYMAYTQTGRYSYWGMFGLTEDLDNLNTGKWLGYVDAMKGPAPPVTSAVMLPSGPGQSVELIENPGTSDKVVSPGPEPWAMFLLNAPVKATYSFVLRGRPQGPSCQARLMIDNSLSGTSKLPVHSKKDTAAPPVNVALEPGLHSLFVFLDGTQAITVSPQEHLTILQTGK